MDNTTTVTLQVNGQQAEETLLNLRKRAIDLQAEIAKAAAEGDKVTLKKLKREFTQVSREIKQIESSTQQAENVLRRLDHATPQELQKALQTLTKQLNYIERGSAAWDKQTEKIRQVKDEINRINAEMARSQSLVDRFNNAFQKWQTIGAGVIGALTGLTLAGRKAVNNFADMEQEMANVRKYTGMTAEQVEHLNQEFLKIDTRSTRDQLNKLAQEAGRLGKTSEEDVLGFVRAADKINVALDELGDGATLTLSKLTNIFGDEKRLGTEKSMLAVGSVINELSQNCTASAGYLAAFAQRLAGVGAQAKMTIPEIMAFGAVLDSQGQKVEMSATALSKVIMNLFKDTSKIASATGLDLNELNAALSRSTNEGLLMLLQRLHDLGGIDTIAPVFKDMGENGARASAVLSALAGNINMIRWEQDEANKAFEEATSVNKEFEVQNTTVQATIEKAKKRFSELTIQLGEKLLPVMRHVITTSSLTMRALNTMVDFIIENRREIAILISSIAAYTLAINAAIIKEKLHSALILTKTAALHLHRVAVLAASAAYNRLTGNVTRANAAMKLLHSTMKLNPWGLLTAAIVASVSALSLYIRKQRETTAEQKAEKDVQKTITEQYAEQKGRIDLLVAAVNDEKLALDKRRNALQELRKIIPNYHAELTAEGNLIHNNTAAIDEYLNALNKQIALQAYQDKLADTYRQRAELEMQLDDQQTVANQRETDYRNKTRSANTANTDAAGNRNITFASIGADIAADKWIAAQNEVKKTENDIKEINTVIAAINKKVEQYATGMQQVSNETTETAETTTVTLPEKTDSDTPSNKFQAEDDWREREQALARIAYAKGETDYDAYTKRMLEIEVQYHQKRLAHTDLVGNEQVTIEAAYYEALKKQQDNHLKGTVEDENQAYDTLLMNLQQRYVDGQMTARQYQNATEMAELQHLQNIVNLYETGTKERLKAEQNYHRTSLKYQQKHIQEDRKLQEQLQEEYFTKNFHIADPDSYQRDLRNVEIVYQQLLNTAGTNAKDRLQIERAFQEAKYQLARKYNMKAEADTVNSFRNAIDTSVEWLNSDGGQAMVQTMDLLISQMSQIFSSLSDIVQSELDIQTAAIEARYETEISHAEGNKSKEVALEKEKEAQIAKAKQEANRKQFAMEVMQAIAQTATAAIAAFSSAAAIPMVGFMLAPAAAAMAVAAGAVQIAAIKKQQEASEATGYKEGGFTRKGKPDEVAGVVHAGEWVASQALLANPEARAIINTLDYAQRNNTIASLRADDVSRSITAPIRLADTLQRETTNAQPSTRSHQRATTNVSGANELTPLLTKLNQRLSEPFVTINTVTGDAGIQKAQSDYQRLIRNKTPKSRR